MTTFSGLDVDTRALHDAVAAAFHAEAAVMRSMCWWVPAASRYDHKLAAAELAYLHMRNADDLRRLAVDVMRLDIGPETFHPASAGTVAALCALADFDAVCETLGARPPREVDDLLAVCERTPALFDHHAVEAADQVGRRYASAIAPARAGRGRVRPGAG